LTVKDLGIIENIHWKPCDGLNVITGETGAGKSLIIDAIELLLTGNSNDDIIRSGANETRIEGIFSLSPKNNSSHLRALLQEKDLISDKETLILTCVIRKNKPAIIKINGQAVTKYFLRQIGELLIDIHGQSDHLSLLDKKQNTYFLDAYAHTLEFRKNFVFKLAQLNEILSELNILSQKELDSVRQEEFLRFQIEEIKRADLHEEEDEELEKERHIISHSEKLREYSEQVYQSLYEGSPSQYSSSALTKVNEALKALKKLVELDPNLTQQLNYLDKSIYGIEEVARDIHSYAETIQDNPSRLDEIESRLELIRNLKRKYGKTISEILSYFKMAELELEGFRDSFDKQIRLKQQKETLKLELGLLAMELSQKRSQAAANLVLSVEKELETLQMSQMKFEVLLSHIPSPEGIGVEGEYFAFNNDGIDNVEFLVSSNPGELLKPIAKIASTGELSRFTLALKGVLSEADNIPVLLFDEIDIGIGGRSGDIIGKKLWALSRNHQVICVTHLPQIAVYADNQFYVNKNFLGDRTTSSLEQLSYDQRLKEIAAMLDGSDFGETALKNAAELINKAQVWKNPITNNNSRISTQLSF
jgi:DNA repair protein RecN (Recombination protein N)